MRANLMAPTTPKGGGPPSMPRGGAYKYEKNLTWLFVNFVFSVHYSLSLFPVQNPPNFHHPEKTYYIYSH